MFKCLRHPGSTERATCNAEQDGENMHRSLTANSLLNIPRPSR